MSNVEVAKDYVDEDVSFEDLNLDPRLIQAINKLGYEHPTLVQTQAIRLSLQEKKDIIARASTGSGKTAAYCIPIIQSILADNDTKEQIQAVILVPTKELAKQVTDFLRDLTLYCGKAVKTLNLNDGMSDELLGSLLGENPEIIVSTPSKLVGVLEKTKDLDLTHLKYLVIDEVDLIANYGYTEDLQALSKYLSLKQNMQVFLMSATLSDDVQELKKQFCSKPAVLKLQDVEDDSKKLVQYYIKTNELDKFLIAYVVLKLNLIKGKVLVFVNNLDRGYKLKLFLQNFGIRSAVLNSELPLNSRMHIVDQFNQNVYHLLIATDDSNEYDEDAQQTNGDDEGEEDSEEKRASKQKKAGAKESGFSRGVDFRNVACVLNFDLPTSSKSYVHRVGRTARGGKSGMALSFVVNKKDWGKHRPSSLESAKKDEKVLERIERTQKKLGYELKPYQFDTKQLDNFRYRMEDSFRSVTKAAIRDARLREIESELMNSEKLKRHFEENPEDLVTLRHDKPLAKVRADQNLKDVPDYLLPKSARKDPTKIGFVPFNKNNGRSRKRQKKGGKKKVDPLKRFRR